MGLIDKDFGEAKVILNNQQHFVFGYNVVAIIIYYHIGGF
jgi:hypothetical protein